MARPSFPFSITAFVAAALVLGGCSAAPTATPAAPPTSATTSATQAAETPTQASTTSPAPTAPQTTALPGPSATPDAPRAGEPLLLFNRFVGDDRKAAFIVRPDGMGEHRILPEDLGDVRAISWSPDGRRIVFAVRDATTPDGSVWTANADGSSPTRLYDGHADGCDAVFYPVWSPDAASLAMVCYAGAAGTPQLPNAAKVVVLDVKSRHLTVLATFHWPDFLDNPPAWSPDGRTLAFDILHWDPTNTFLDGSLVATVRADGSKGVRRLTRLDSFAAYPAWSPDGRTIVYNTYDLGNMGDAGPSNLYAMAPDGTRVHQLTWASTGHGYRIAQPRWDPDGTRIWVTVSRDGKVGIGWVDPTTGVVTELPVSGARPEPRPQP